MHKWTTLLQFSVTLCLKLIFAKPNGEYLANVNVKIRDRKGNELINTVFLAHLRAGHYTATVMLKGQSKTQDIVLHDEQEFII